MDRENVIVNNYGIDMPQEDAFEDIYITSKEAA